MEVEKILGDDLDEILLSLILTLIITGFVFYLYLERERGAMSEDGGRKFCVT
jgi:hypothetical protein